MRWLAVQLLLPGLILAGCSREHDAAPHVRPRFSHLLDVARFQRGNLHTHTNASDGDAPPAEVIGWYKTHGYAFVAITDHNIFTDPSRYAALQGPDFVVIPGEEISMWVTGKQVHVNALCTRAPIAGGDFVTAKSALQAAVGNVREQAGVAVVNHPNFDWALGQDDVLAVAGSAQLLEIASGHPYVHSQGDAAHPSHEALWDSALTAGSNVMGVAVDDVHHVRASADPPAFPGVAWVEVFATSPDPEQICQALHLGELYASTGPALRRIRVTDQAYAIEVLGEADSIEFIGEHGRQLELHEHPTALVTYRLHGDEGYVRARIKSGVTAAWTPAIRVTLD